MSSCKHTIRIKCKKNICIFNTVYKNSKNNEQLTIIKWNEPWNNFVHIGTPEIYFPNVVFKIQWFGIASIFYLDVIGRFIYTLAFLRVFHFLCLLREPANIFFVLNTHLRKSSMNSFLSGFGDWTLYIMWNRKRTIWFRKESHSVFSKCLYSVVYIM